MVGKDTNQGEGDVYFTISAVINNMRNTPQFSPKLSQNAYVRNLIGPHNFHRFNDGIVQAAILRSAHAAELTYNIDENLSQEMFTILSNLVDHFDDAYGEGLMEFIFAVGSSKLKLHSRDVKEFFELIETKITDEFITAFANFAKFKLGLVADPKSIPAKPEEASA
jgi:hypothetical protein